MGGLFSKPKVVTAPSVPPTPPIPTVGEEVEDIARRKRPRGFREQFLTGALEPSETFLEGKKKKLG